MSDESLKPNPNYNPNYGKKVSAFSPTLRMEITEERFREYEDAGVTVADAENMLSGFFRKAKVTDGVLFTSEAITVLETGQVLKNFETTVVATFEIDDVLHLKLATGDVVAAKLYRS
jgi:hypothetical protein